MTQKAKGESVWEFVGRHLKNKPEKVINDAVKRFKFRPRYRKAGGMETLKRTVRSLYHRQKHA